VAASVVIHYDRWWNAAREDQATDRVHRIGQRRGVQVFKLITEGTLEEKIAVMIDKKRGLLNGVVKEDDPGLLKSFTRQDLMEMLSGPQF
jgi:SNF2 family DNA or RNA helicase